MERLEYLFTAMEITEDTRKRALLLHYADEEVSDIYDILIDEAKSYASTKAALERYFKRRKNLTFEVYNFRQLKQNDDGKKSQTSEETVDQYLSRLKEAGLRCEFHDLNRELKDQLVFHCKSDALRRKALRDDPSLEYLLKYARAIESSESQAKIIETERESDVYVVKQPGKYSSRKSLPQKETHRKTKQVCYKCGKSWPHTEDGGICPGATRKSNSCFNCGKHWPHNGGNSTCPARGKTCNICKGENHFSTVCPNKSSKVQLVQNEEYSDESSDDNYCYQVQFSSSPKQANTGVNGKINNRKSFLKIDTGSDVNFLDEAMYDRIKDTVKLMKPKIKLLGYNSNRPLTTIGKFSETLEVRDRICVAEFYVVTGRSG